MSRLSCVLCLALLCVVSLSTHAETATKQHLVCEKPRFDFGSRDETEKVTHTFIIKNAGTTPIKIAKTRTSCGCTVAEIAKRQLKPGDITYVTATLSLKGRKGRQSKSITLVTDVSDEPSLKLWMEGDVWSPLTIAPESIHFRSVQSHAKGKRTVDVLVSESTAFNIISATSKHKHLKVTTETVDGGVFYRVHVELVPPLPRGVLRDKIIIKTDSDRFKQFTIPITANVAGPVAVTPTQLMLPKTAKQPLVRYVLLSSVTKKPFKIESVVAPEGSAITTQIRPLGKRGYRVRLAGLRPEDATSKTKIVITTNVPEMKTIELPITLAKP